jgi:hypothetical protein
MAEETGTLLNGAITDGVAAGLGIGQAVAALFRRCSRRTRLSLFAAAARSTSP